VSFYTERTIKAVRKVRPCDGCGVKLEVGESALACSGHNDNNVWSATFHHECRKAEEGLNKLYGTWDDEWLSLSDLEWDDWPWLITKFPAVAKRMKITLERFNEVQAERESVHKAWAAIDARPRTALSPKKEDGQ
jgi:hypothetical protein